MRLIPKSGVRVVNDSANNRLEVDFASHLRQSFCKMTKKVKTIYCGYPGGSKSRVNRAGKSILNGVPQKEDFAVLDEWRASHRQVLNTFQAILRIRSKDKDITVAQRHKRKTTILDKLKRHPKMELSRMDDVAGCRLIFRSNDELYAFRKSLHQAHFKHKLRNTEDKYDYIKKPKATGYRGVHDVYEYDVRSESGRPLRGLLVELQYRTLIQHSWATAVEVIGLITKSEPKFQRGDKRYELAMAYASEILARSAENHYGPFPDLTSRKVVAEFRKLDKDLKLMKLLKGVKVADTTLTKGGDVILIFQEDGSLEIKNYGTATEALYHLFHLENKSEGEDIVLVRGASTADVRLAYKNYFGDTSDFVSLVYRGCEILSPRIMKKRHNKALDVP